MGAICYFHYLRVLFALLCCSNNCVSPQKLPPSPQLDPDWISQGWVCAPQTDDDPRNPGSVDCIKLLPGTAHLQDGDRLCASLKRDQVDRIVPTLLIINSKHEQDSLQLLNQIKLAAGIGNGGSLGFWVGPGAYRDSRSASTSSSLSQGVPDTPPPPPGQLTFSEIFASGNNHRETVIRHASEEPHWYRPDCGELQVEVTKKLHNYTTTVSWSPKWCSDRGRVVCMTRKVRTSYVLDKLERQRNEIAGLIKEIDRLNAKVCFAPANSGGHVTLYEHKGHRGHRVYMDVRNGCANVPGGMDNEASAADAHGGCVHLCEDYNCQGRCEVIVGLPRITNHGDLAGFGFNDLVSSVKPCM